MREMIRMVVVLTVLSAFSGGLLAAIRNGTQEDIENQKMKYDKAPAIKLILEGASNDPIADRFKLADGDIQRDFFVGKFDGEAKVVVFETFGSGYGGKLGVMVGMNVAEDKIVGVGVTSHNETPGLGARAKTEVSFAGQFKGLAAEEVKVTKDGGAINALSGATITSRTVCVAASEAVKVYQRLKPQIEEQLKGFK